MIPGNWTVAEMLAKIGEMQEALEPFAALAPIYARRPDWQRLVSTAQGDISVADLRRAAAAIKTGPMQ